MKRLFFILAVLCFALYGCKNGTDGSDGDAVNSGDYLGELDTPPECTDETKGDTYRNDGVVYKCTGDGWMVYLRDGEDGGDASTDSTGDTDVVTYSPSGKAENGPFKKDSRASVIPLSSSWKQIGPEYEGYTESNDGSYQIHADITSQYGRFKISGSAYNQVSNTYQDVELRLITDMDNEYFNINPLTHIQAILTDSSDGYFWNPLSPNYQDADNAILQARRDILDYFGLPDYGVEFSQMSLQVDSTADAVLFIADTFMVNGRTGPEQNDYAREIATGILNGDLSLKQEIQDGINSIRFKETCDNLVSEYYNIGIQTSCPPVEAVEYGGAKILPDYYSELIRGDQPRPIELFNTSATTPSTIDMAYNYFLYPIVFNNIENAKYIATNLSGDLSIWTVKQCDGDSSRYCPDSKVLDIEEMRERFFDDPVSLPYNGYFGDHPLISGTNYFIRQYSEQGSTPVIYTGDVNYWVPFGKNLYSNDEDWENSFAYASSISWVRFSVRAVTY